MEVSLWKGQRTKRAGAARSLARRPGEAGHCFVRRRAPRRALSAFDVQDDGCRRRRLHGAVGYVTPQAELEGRAEAIHAERDRKLAAAREARRLRRQATRMSLASESGRTPRVSESGSHPTDELESPCSSVASASPHPVLGGVEATERKGRPPAVPEPRPSTPAGGQDEYQVPHPRRRGELLKTMGGLSNSR